MLIFVLIILSSVLMALSQLTSWGYLALVAYVPLIWVTRRQNPGQVFRSVLLATALQYMATLYWLTIAMSVFGHLPWVASWIILGLLSLLIGCYLAFACALARYLEIRLGWSYLLLFPVALSACEYARNYGFIASFPWGASGYSLVSTPLLMQAASLIGVYGLAFLIGMINASFLARSWLVKTGVAVLLLGWGTYGYWRLQPSSLSTETIKVALLQGNIEQGIKNQSAIHGVEILGRYENLQRQALAEKADLVVWPESSYPYRLQMEEPRWHGLSALAPLNIISALATDAQGEFYNSAFILDQNEQILGHFDKNHLVPFGEYVPWPFSRIVDKLVPNLGSFGRGKELKPLRVSPKLSLAVTVCYEGVFPEIGRDFVNQGANLLVNITNDAWYGFSAGPYQHLNMYQMRSVEMARSYARATNTGVSAWIDARGFVHHPTSLYEEALVVADIPLEHEITVYAQMGDLIPGLCLWLLLIGFIIAKRPRTRNEWLRALLALVIVLVAHAHFTPLRHAFDESALTKEMLCWFVALGLMCWPLSLCRFISFKKGSKA